jgi:hypothetical protein
MNDDGWMGVHHPQAAATKAAERPPQRGAWMLHGIALSTKANLSASAGRRLMHCHRPPAAAACLPIIVHASVLRFPIFFFLSI